MVLLASGFIPHQFGQWETVDTATSYFFRKMGLIYVRRSELARKKHVPVELSRSRWTRCISFLYVSCSMPEI
jgi:hypothetical protein